MGRDERHVLTGAALISLVLAVPLAVGGGPPSDAVTLAVVLAAVAITDVVPLRVVVGREPFVFSGYEPFVAAGLLLLHPGLAAVAVIGGLAVGGALVGRLPFGVPRSPLEPLHLLHHVVVSAPTATAAAVTTLVLTPLIGGPGAAAGGVTVFAVAQPILGLAAVRRSRRGDPLVARQAAAIVRLMVTTIVGLLLTSLLVLGLLTSLSHTGQLLATGAVLALYVLVAATLSHAAHLAGQRAALLHAAEALRATCTPLGTLEVARDLTVALLQRDDVRITDAVEPDVLAYEPLGPLDGVDRHLTVTGADPRRLEEAQAELLRGLAVLGSAALERTRTQQRLADEAVRDPLTGVLNRRGLQDRFGPLAATARRADQGLAVLYLDLDGFKRVNDEHGHAAGDALLRACAATLVRTARQGDLVARIGGDEFVLVLAGPSDDAQADAARRRTAARLRAATAGPSTLEVTIGVARWGRDGTTLAALLDAADRDMYAERARPVPASSATDDRSPVTGRRPARP